MLLRGTILLLCSALWGCTHPWPVSSSNAAPTVSADQVAARWQGTPGAAAVLLGELHDDPSHPPLQLALLQTLLQQGPLAALVLEMAEQGRSTQGLPRHADEATVQAALAWSEPAWPWARYRLAVMTAVAAGVPVLGGNLPRAQMRAAMTDATWDQQLPPERLQQVQALIRRGHCGLLPETQIPAMARIQVARDRAMADTLAQAWRPGTAVLLLAGNEHVRTDLGVPWHLAQQQPAWAPGAAAVRAIQLRPASDDPHSAVADTWPTPPQPPRDHCAALRQQLRQSAP
jgi:uncharacterized iron-regulated protein